MNPSATTSKAKSMRLKRLADKVAQISRLVENLSMDKENAAAAAGQPAPKRVRFNPEGNVCIVIERSNKKEVMGEPGVDNWMQFAKQRQMSAMMARKTVAQLCEMEEAAEELEAVMAASSSSSSSSSASSASDTDSDSDSEEPKFRILPNPAAVDAAQGPVQATAGTLLTRTSRRQFSRISRNQRRMRIKGRNMTPKESAAVDAVSTWAANILKERSNPNLAQTNILPLSALHKPVKGAKKTLALPPMAGLGAKPLSWALPTLKQYNQRPVSLASNPYTNLLAGVC